MLRFSATLLAAIALLGCSAGALSDHRTATGSDTLVASSDYGRLYAVNEDEGTVSVTTAKGALP